MIYSLLLFHIFIYIRHEIVLYRACTCMIHDVYYPKNQGSNVLIIQFHDIMYEFIFDSWLCMYKCIAELRVQGFYTFSVFVF